MVLTLLADKLSMALENGDFVTVLFSNFSKTFNAIN